MAGRQVFVVPAAGAISDEAISGGNVYNAGLIGALRAAGAEVATLDREAAAAALARGEAGHYWLDSLYLEDAARLAAARRGPARLGLLMHWLPSLVRHGALGGVDELGAGERAALAVGEAFVVTSAYMAGVLRGVGVARPILVVRPGLDVAGELGKLESGELGELESGEFGKRGELESGELGELEGLESGETARGRLRGLVVANLTAGKGVLPLLAALAPHVRTGAPVALEVIGSGTHDADYARACRDFVAAEPALAAAVRLVGARAHAATLQAMARSDVIISASRMESYGLALAEARALGVPIVAYDAGNAAEHVVEAAGGRLCAGDAELAAECARLGRDRRELYRRRAAARARRPAPRSHADAARDFLAAVAAL